MAVPGNGNADGGNADGVVTASLLGPVPDLSGPGEWDQGIRPQSTVETLAGLKPAFGDDGLHHAGNSSQLTDGAAVVAVCGQQQAAQWGLAPMARIVATDVIGVDPTMMLHGVIPVTRRILDRAGLSVDDIDLFEVNEAFASVPLAWLREIGAPADRLNVNGGAIALGHPTGCSGTRIMTTLVHELCRRQGRYGLQVMCIGGGMATATLIEAIQGVHGHGG